MNFWIIHICNNNKKIGIKNFLLTSNINSLTFEKLILAPFLIKWSIRTFFSDGLSSLKSPSLPIKINSFRIVVDSGVPSLFNSPVQKRTSRVAIPFETKYLKRGATVKSLLTKQIISNEKCICSLMSRNLNSVTTNKFIVLHFLLNYLSFEKILPEKSNFACSQILATILPHLHV